MCIHTGECKEYYEDSWIWGEEEETEDSEENESDSDESGSGEGSGVGKKVCFQYRRIQNQCISLRITNACNNLILSN